MSRLPADPYTAVIRAFTRAGIRYVVIGMSGINYYAHGPSEAFATMDYDVFLEPTLQNVRKAVRALERLGCSLGTTQGALKRTTLGGVVRRRQTLIATTSDGCMVELLLAVSGYAFGELAKDAVTIVVHGTPIRVGRLTKLLQSKRIADRPKDRQFLRRYRMLLDEAAAHARVRRGKQSTDSAKPIRKDRDR